MLATTGQLDHAPCWLAAKPKPRAYLPGCTIDECHGHTDRALAAVLCDAYDGGCGGVTLTPTPANPNPNPNPKPN
eukprot:scaffold95232_cov39-Phaeocystis_antarctica.AAC.1